MAHREVLNKGGGRLSIFRFALCALQFHVYRERTYKVINNLNPVPFNKKINPAVSVTSSTKKSQYSPMISNAKMPLDKTI
jgi:hypothetical protein